MKKLLALLLVAVVAAAYFFIQQGDGPGADGPAVEVLNRGLSTDPESIDPHKARSTQAAEVLRDIGEGLMSYSATAELVGGVASTMVTAGLARLIATMWNGAVACWAPGCWGWVTT